MATAVVVVAVAAVLLIAIEQDNRDIAISNIHDTGHYWQHRMSSVESSSATHVGRFSRYYHILLLMRVSIDIDILLQRSLLFVCCSCYHGSQAISDWRIISAYLVGVGHGSQSFLNFNDVVTHLVTRYDSTSISIPDSFPSCLIRASNCVTKPSTVCWGSRRYLPISSCNNSPNFFFFFNSLLTCRINLWRGLKA